MIAGIAALVQSRAGASNVGTSVPAETRMTSGMPPHATLPGDGQPIAAAADGEGVAILAMTPGETPLVLYRVARSGRVATHPLRIANAGLWAGIAVASDGTIWAGAQDRIVSVTTAGAMDTYRLPAVTSRLAGPLAGPISPTGPIENGQITALAVQGGSLRIGRAGATELTSFDLSSRTFSQQPLPVGVGDIAALAGSGANVIFSVNHSGTAPGRLADVIGIVEPDGRIAIIRTGAQSIASNGRAIAIGNAGTALLDASGASRRNERPGGYDGARLAIKANDTVYIRVAGTNAVAVVNGNGDEISRIAYQVPILPRRDGRAPYTARWAFAVTSGDDAVWFAALGRPEIYRIP